VTDSSLPLPLQESILAALVFDEGHGAIIAAQVRADHFDEQYREIAKRLLGYRQRYGRAPGQAHLDDLFGTELLTNNKRAPRLRRVLTNLTLQSEGLNAEYVASRTQHFIRSQQLKLALVRGSERYMQGGDEAVDEVEGILAEALRFRSQTMDAGTFMNDPDKALAFLKPEEEQGYTLGIKELDKLGIMLAPKEFMLYIGPKGSGKTWACIHVGLKALLQKASVLHVTLEVSEEITAGRYLQMLFGMAKHEGQVSQSLLELDELGRLVGFTTKKRTPKLVMSDPNIKRELRQRMKKWGAKLGRLVIKEFPTGSLKVAQLIGYLDYLEMTHGFVPNVLIVDYPDLMHFNKDNYRIALGTVTEELRGIAVERRLALFAPSQGNKQTMGARYVRSKDVAEDVRKVNTADNVITYSQTDGERRQGLARLHVAHARNNESGDTVLITQSYATGQFCMDSALMQKAYWDRLKAVTGDEVDPEETEE
jgi:replicative DNA helicase